MTNYLNELDLGQSITVRGPFGKLTYLGDGNFKILKKFKPLTFLEKRYTKVGMIAGGSGITPFFQVRILRIISFNFFFHFFTISNLLNFILLFLSK
jgi:NAD(P)H-flavin reductase